MITPGSLSDAIMNENIVKAVHACVTNLRNDQIYDTFSPDGKNGNAFIMKMKYDGIMRDR